MAKKYEFQPDKPYANWLSQLQLTKLQRRQVLKWCLYALVLMVISVIQDVVLCRMRFYGGCTDLVPCAIFLICILEGSHQGCIFALAASYLYLMSGSAAGPQVLVLITVPAILVCILREVYLRPKFLSALICAMLAMVLYELLVFGFCLLLGSVTFGRIFSFLVTALISLVAVPPLYLIAKPIMAIGGTSWKD